MAINKIKNGNRLESKVIQKRADQWCKIMAIRFNVESIGKKESGHTTEFMNNNKIFIIIFGTLTLITLFSVYMLVVVL